MKRSRRWLAAIVIVTMGGSLAAMSLAGPKVEESGLVVKLVIPACMARGGLADTRTVRYWGT